VASLSAGGSTRQSGRQGPTATIVASHGLTAVKEMYLDDLGAYFAAAGLNALVYDHRNFGDSDGTPRQEADPVMQQRDMRHAISYATTRPDVDESRIGLWGTSYTGGVAIVVTAVDRRVRAVVSQVPGVSGAGQAIRAVRPDLAAHLRGMLDGDRMNRFAGGEPGVVAAVSPDPTGPAMMPDAGAWEWFTEAAKRAPNWKNEVTVRSMEMAGEYEPISYISGVSPTPLLMIVADNDVVAPVALALEAYELAKEPKKLVLMRGGHFDAYQGAGFEESAAAARDHFLSRLNA
jgi:uncharacterized protein